MKAKFWLLLNVEVTAEGADEQECRVNAVKQLDTISIHDVEKAIDRAERFFPGDITELVEVIEG